MASREDVALMSHLMRRAGFGATRDEIERYCEIGYEETVEMLLNPKDQPPVDEYSLYRYHPITEIPGGAAAPGQANWLYCMVTTQRPLEEKMALFWHHVFATGNSKVDNCNHLLEQIDMFREHGIGNYRDLLVGLARNPAMIYWLDNNENHKRAPNENWGRELLELFSLGVGHYTETDVFECSRAFTGWTIDAKMPRYPYGRHKWAFTFRPEDHDFTEKTFLGHTGNFDGEDIIDIILQQEACPGSSPGTCTTSSSPTSPRCPPGTSKSLATPKLSASCPIPSSRPATRSSRCCASFSTRTTSRSLSTER